MPKGSPLHDRTVQAGRRMVSRGERPLYRVRVSTGSHGLLEARCVDMPAIVIEARGRVEVVDRAGQAIAAELEVPPAALAVVVDESTGVRHGDVEGLNELDSSRVSEHPLDRGHSGGTNGP